MTIDAAKKNKIEVNICGEMAGDIIAVPLLVGLGIDQLSMNPSKIYNVCSLIPRFNKSEAEAITKKAMRLKTLKEVESLLFDFNLTH